MHLFVLIHNGMLYHYYFLNFAPEYVTMGVRFQVFTAASMKRLLPSKSKGPETAKTKGLDQVFFIMLMVLI